MAKAKFKPEGDQDLVEGTLPEVIAAFTEWDRRYREEPERFMSEAQHLLKETADTYGDKAGRYFAMILTEVRGG